MHELILMRHAQALPAAIEGDDFARPLADTGRAAAARAAHKLAAGAAIERVLFSPAHRTSETAAIVAGGLLIEPAGLQAVPELYLATPAAVRAAIAHWHGNAHTLLIVGHNPSLSELGGQLDDRLSNTHLPTAGFWRLRLDDQAWQALARP